MCTRQRRSEKKYSANFTLFFSKEFKILSNELVEFQFSFVFQNKSLCEWKEMMQDNLVH